MGGDCPAPAAVAPRGRRKTRGSRLIPSEVEEGENARSSTSSKGAERIPRPSTSLGMKRGSAPPSTAEQQQRPGEGEEVGQAGAGLALAGRRAAGVGGAGIRTESSGVDGRVPRIRR